MAAAPYPAYKDLQYPGIIAMNFCRPVASSEHDHRANINAVGPIAQRHRALPRIAYQCGRPDGEAPSGEHDRRLISMR
ncbi:hypothetical protein KCP69_03950 [Salmonella enterica subsp. enterica]|nr:hypothetical protein KCP69_03950 [Salmonella enterica subsp. enterica]